MHSENKVTHALGNEPGTVPWQWWPVSAAGVRLFLLFGDCMAGTAGISAVWLRCEGWHGWERGSPYFSCSFKNEIQYHCSRSATRVKFVINDCQVFRCSGNEAIWMSGVCASLHSWRKTCLFPWQPLCICTAVAALHPTWKHQASLLKIIRILLCSYPAI